MSVYQVSPFVSVNEITVLTLLILSVTIAHMEDQSASILQYRGSKWSFTIFYLKTSSPFVPSHAPQTHPMAKTLPFPSLSPNSQTNPNRSHSVLFSEFGEGAQGWLVAYLPCWVRPLDSKLSKSASALYIAH